MKIKSLIAATVLFGMMYLIPVNVAQAHGEAGLTFTSTTTEGYIVDVDYRDAYIEADRIGRFDFGLFADGTREKQVAFSDMWIRIVRKDGSKVGETLFAGGVANQEYGGDGFSFMFPEGGTYALNVRYNDTSKNTFGDTVGEAEFELNVLRNPEEDKFKFGMEFWVGLIGGLFIPFLGLLPFLTRKNT